MKRALGVVLIGAVALTTPGCKKEQPQVSPPTEKAAVQKPEPPAPSTPGVTDRTILVGQWSPQTGPAALWGAVARGTQAYFEMINAEGGIHGRKLKLLIRNDAYQPAQTKSVVLELVEKEGVFAFVGGVGTGTGMAVKDYLAQKKIPWIGPASGSSQWATVPSKNLFSVYPTYATEAKALVRYLLDTAKKKKIAFLYQNDDYGKEGLEGATEEMTKRGKKLVAAVSVEMTDQDLSSHILKIKQAKPDAVILFVLPKHAAIALGTAAKLKLRPQWASTSTLSDAPLMHTITKGLWEGVVFTAIMELPDSEHPLIKKYREAYERYGKKLNSKEMYGVFFLAGFFFAEPFVEALKRTGPELTREKLIQSLESIQNWNGGTGHNLTFGPTERQGYKAVFIAQCKGGKAVKVADWMTIE